MLDDASRVVSYKDKINKIMIAVKENNTLGTPSVRTMISNLGTNTIMYSLPFGIMPLNLDLIVSSPC